MVLFGVDWGVAFLFFSEGVQIVMSLLKILNGFGISVGDGGIIVLVFGRLVEAEVGVGEGRPHQG